MLLHHRQVLAMQQCSPPPMGLWPGPTSCSGRSHTVRAVSKSLPRPALQASAGAATSSSSRHPQSVTFFSSSQRLDFSSRDAHQGCRSVSNSQTGRNMEEIEDLEVDQLEELEEEDLDALFEEFGEVVRSDKESNNVTSEVDEDSDSLAFAVAMAEAANDVKGNEIQVMCVKPLIYWARFFVVVTAFSKPQIDAVGKRMKDIAEEKFNRSPKGDNKPNSWTLLDFGDVVVHIFLPKERAFYNLEEFYGNATLVSLPFENRSLQ